MRISVQGPAESLSPDCEAHVLLEESYLDWYQGRPTISLDRPNFYLCFHRLWTLELGHAIEDKIYWCERPLQSLEIDSSRKHKSHSWRTALGFCAEYYFEDAVACNLIIRVFGKPDGLPTKRRNVTKQKHTIGSVMTSIEDITPSLEDISDGVNLINPQKNGSAYLQELQPDTAWMVITQLEIITTCNQSIHALAAKGW